MKSTLKELFLQGLRREGLSRKKVLLLMDFKYNERHEVFQRIRLPLFELKVTRMNLGNITKPEFYKSDYPSHQIICHLKPEGSVNVYRSKFNLMLFYEIMNFRLVNKKREEIMEVLALFGKEDLCYSISLDLVNFFLPEV